MATPTTTIREIITYIESIAPPSLQESYDNAGLLTGHGSWTVKGVLITLDCIEAVIDEAIQKKCNVVIAHHPIIFSGLKKINGNNYVEKVIIKAIKNDIAIYAAHTNLDNVLQNGVNQKIAQKLKLENIKILAPRKRELLKLYTYIPEYAVDTVNAAVWSAGAGHIGNYSECSFGTSGIGTFKPNQLANPTIGKKGKIEKVVEVKCEYIMPKHLSNQVLNALKASHPYEEVAFEIIQLENEWQEAGSGIVGELAQPLSPKQFLQYVKEKMKIQVIRYTSTSATKIQRVALCGGAGSFLLKNAIQAGAQAYISADFKYHEFFDAENQIQICDIGHYESEQYTKEIFNQIISKKFSTFAVHLSKINTNPINYFY